MCPPTPVLKAYEASQGKQAADKVAKYFGPAVEHLGKWMPLYLAPPLIVLPNALGEVKKTNKMNKLFDDIFI